MPWISSQSRRKGAAPSSLKQSRDILSSGIEELETSQCCGAEETKAESNNEEIEVALNQPQPADLLPKSADANDSTFASRRSPSEKTESADSRDLRAEAALAPRVLPAWADRIPQGITRNLPALLALASMLNPTTEAATSAPYLFGGLSLAAAAEGLKYYGEAHATQAQVCWEAIL